LPVTTLLLSYFNARLLPLVRAVRARNQRRGRSAGAVGTDFWLPIAPVNWALTAVFAGEAGRLTRALSGKRQGYAAGASLVALLRREEGTIPVRSKPANLAPDHPVK
jgi:hypothetical protein